MGPSWSAIDPGLRGIEVGINLHDIVVLCCLLQAVGSLLPRILNRRASWRHLCGKRGSQGLTHLCRHAGEGRGGGRLDEMGIGQNTTSTATLMEPCHAGLCGSQYRSSANGMHYVSSACSQYRSASIATLTICLGMSANSEQSFLGEGGR